jgi:signal peptidase I
MWLLPIALTVIAFRFLVPSLAEAPPGTTLHGLARFASEQPALVGAAVLLLFGALVTYWRGVLMKKPPPSSSGRKVWSTVLAAAAAAASALAFGQLFRPARVMSTSMVPTLLPSDRLWVDQPDHTPKRGEVIVFRHRGDGDAGDLVKRVIGLPGDRIRMIDSRPVISGTEVPSCDAGTYVYYVDGKSSRGHLVLEWLDGRAYLTIYQPGAYHFDEYTVKPGEVFVLGDNRGVSNDSRSWVSPGVALGDIEGRVERVLFGAGRGGELDAGRVWQPLGTGVHLSGVDLEPLRAGIARCLDHPPAAARPDQPVKSQ